MHSVIHTKLAEEDIITSGIFYTIYKLIRASNASLDAACVRDLGLPFQPKAPRHDRYRPQRIIVPRPCWQLNGKLKADSCHESDWFQHLIQMPESPDSPRSTKPENHPVTGWNVNVRGHARSDARPDLALYLPDFAVYRLPM